MSFAYSAIPPPPPIKSNLEFGYQKVNETQLNEIVSRLQQPTYTSSQHLEEVSDQVSLPRSRPVSSRCRKANVDLEWIAAEGTSLRASRPLSGRSVDRLVQRLQTPTKSLLSSHSVTMQLYTQFLPNYDDSTSTVTDEQPGHDKDVDLREHREVQRNIQRPTTASSLKKYKVCARCTELGTEKERRKYYGYLEPSIITDPCSEDERILNITRRVQSPTLASRGGQGSCTRHSCSRTTCSPVSTTQLPLMSGLKRSKNIDDIVSRLYRPTKAIPIIGRKSSLAQSGVVRSRSTGVPRGKRKDILPPSTI